MSRCCVEAGDLPGQGSNDAAPLRIVAMLHREIGLDDGAEPAALRSSGRARGQLLPGGGQRPTAGLGRQLLLGGEMLVESAMRQAGLRHDVRNADAANAVLAELP